MTKKIICCSSLLLLLMCCFSTASAQARWGEGAYIWITPTCENGKCMSDIIISAAPDTDKITATIYLYRGATKIKTWSVTAYDDTLCWSGSTSAESGHTYTWKVSASIYVDGKKAETTSQEANVS